MKHTQEEYDNNMFLCKECDELTDGNKCDSCREDDLREQEDFLSGYSDDDFGCNG